MATRICINCGKKQTSIATFCGTCGQELPPPKEKKPANKKLIFGVLGAVMAIAILVTGLTIVFPPPLTEKDVQITLEFPSEDLIWDGEKFNVNAKVKFKVERDSSYRVVVSMKKAGHGDWQAAFSKDGEYPMIQASDAVNADFGLMQFHALVFAEGSDEPFARSEVYSVKVKKAFLPTDCPIEEIDQNWGGYGDIYLWKYDNTPTYKNCSIGYADSYYYSKVEYRVRTMSQFLDSKQNHDGEDLKVGLNETDAYSIPGIYIPNSDAGSGDTYVIYFHGIELFTEIIGDQDLRTLLNAIVVK